MAGEGIVLPGPDKRQVIVGSTGSGKTVAGLFQLSRVDLHLRPWFILDFKRDSQIAQLNARELPLNASLPSEPGLYVFRPVPSLDDGKVVDLLWRIWAKENCGLYTDEGYMVGARNPAFNALLTQGRSKFIQMITLSQRPVWMSRFVFSEADFWQVFRLNDPRDLDTVTPLINTSGALDFRVKLPPYYSRWYDVGADRGAVFMPVPRFPEIREEINRRLRRKLKVL